MTLRWNRRPSLPRRKAIRPEAQGLSGSGRGACRQRAGDGPSTAALRRSVGKSGVAAAYPPRRDDGSERIGPAVSLRFDLLVASPQASACAVAARSVGLDAHRTRVSVRRACGSSPMLLHACGAARRLTSHGRSHIAADAWGWIPEPGRVQRIVRSRQASTGLTRARRAPDCGRPACASRDARTDSSGRGAARGGLRSPTTPAGSRPCRGDWPAPPRSRRAGGS